MSAIRAYAMALAVAADRAQPVATVRHLHLADAPMVFVPLTMAGEANAPLAAMVGTDRSAPNVLVVPQPRNRDLRMRFAADLADVLLPEIERCCAEVELVGELRRSTDAPQLLVPNTGGIRFIRLLGRATRFRSTTGEYPVDAGVPLLGRWLTWFAERAEHPGSATTLAMTEALSLHWATGQSAVEDANLAALLAWIAAPRGGPSGLDGELGRLAASAAEDPHRWPPAGPATDPGFDNRVLAPAIAAYDEAEPGSNAQLAACDAVEAAVLTQLEPTWWLMWQAVDLLRELGPGSSVEQRWASDRARFTGFADHVAEHPAPQPRRDGAVAAAVRLSRLEREQVGYDAARAFDDPLVMAAHRVTGEAFAGTVVALDRDRRVPTARGALVTRPMLRVATGDPVHLGVGTRLVAVDRPNQTATVLAVEYGPVGNAGPGNSAGPPPGESQTVVTLELNGGMGRSKVPPPGTVPDLGDRLCYTSVLPESVPAATLPPVEETPWTHGGPPQPYLPAEQDAQEAWS